MSFTSDLFTGFATILAAADLGLTYRDDTAYQGGETAILRGQMPPAPDRVVVLGFYVISDDPTLSDSQVGMQVRTRGLPEDTGDCDDLDDALFDFLQNLTVDLPTDLHVSRCFRMSGTPMGVDDAKRSERASNYTLAVHLLSAHRS